MRVVWVNPFPNQPFTAEREFLRRAADACRALGWESSEAVTSDDILAARPDCVLALHELTPKLTPVPTLGLMWNPSAWYLHDPHRLRNVMSYDGFVPGSAVVRRLLADALFSTGKGAALADFEVYPSSPRRPWPQPQGPPDALFYAGVNWDGPRHADLFTALARAVPLHLYGPPGRWEHAGDAYRGEILFDGRSTFERVSQAGAALCLHRPEHRADDLPTMRLFEAAAAGALVITEDTPFARRFLGESACYIDADAPPDRQAARVAEHFHAAARDPAAALARRRDAHTAFDSRLCLEALLEPLPAFVADVRKAACYSLPDRLAAVAHAELPAVEYVMRVGSRPAEVVARAVGSLAAQSYPRLRLVLPQFGPVAGLDDLLARHRGRFESVRVVPVEPSPYRSTPLWAGLRAADAPLLANLDDDDAVHPNHVAALVRRLLDEPAASLVYAGCAQVAEGGGHHFRQPNFDGPAGADVAETRFLWGYGPFNAHELRRFNNFIGSPAWLARREALAPVLADDPQLEVAEDAFLFLSLLARGAHFAFNWWVTAEWYHRFAARDNTTFQADVYARCLERVRLRSGAWHAGICLNPDPALAPAPPPVAAPPAEPADPLTHTQRHVLGRLVAAYLATKRAAGWALVPWRWARGGRE